MSAETDHTARPTRAAVLARARTFHRCPDGYVGPCWGPTLDDLVEAERQLTTEAADG